VLRRLTRIEGCRIVATDGEIGKVRDTYFDDQRWVVRYLVVDTGGWLTGRKVLISPYAVKATDSAMSTITVDLTRDRVARSPDIDTDRPVSRQYEVEYFRYYSYPNYWASTTFWPGGPMPGPTVLPTSDRLELEERRLADQVKRGRQVDYHLRSSREVSGYCIASAEDIVGDIEDFLFDDESWAVRYLIVDLRNGSPGRKVLLRAERAREVDWTERIVRIRQSREDIVRSESFDPDHIPAEVG
jgi:hypothetical protein